jgi:autotransporter-associated beta strand protein
MKTLPRLAALVVTSVALTLSSYASDWTGGDGNWSSNGNPGWNGTGVPNAVGAVANFPDATTSGNFITNVDIPAAVGTINFNANGDLSRAVTAVSNLTMNQDGAGPGFATISNSNPSTGVNNFLNINGGQFGNVVLADDLLVTNTGGSTDPSDALLIGAVIQGSGNVTFSTVGNTVTDQQTAPGSIRIIQASTFVGNVLVQKGAIVTNAGTPSGGAFGNPGNMVTLGQAGQGSVTVMVSSQNVNLQNPFTVAAGTGGTTVLGSLNSQGSTFGGNSATAGNITLNGNLTINSWVTQAASPGALVLLGTISGAGGLTFTTTTTGDPTKVLSELDTFDSFNGVPNTYHGGTIINAGTLIANGDGALGTGNISLTGPNVQLTLKNGTNYIADTATLSLFNNTDKLNLNFTGTDKVGGLIINGVAQAPGIYNSANLSSIITGNGAINVVSAVPEPQTFALIALGSLTLFALPRKRA